MKTLRVLLAGVTVAWLLSSCGSSGGGGGTTATNFTGFVKDRVASTDDTAEPVEINNIDFVFTEDETAFDGIL